MLLHQTVNPKPDLSARVEADANNSRYGPATPASNEYTGDEPQRKGLYWGNIGITEKEMETTI